MYYTANIMKNNFIVIDSALIADVREKIKEFKDAGFRGIPVTKKVAHASILEKFSSNYDYLVGYGIDISDYGDLTIELSNTPVGRTIEDYLLYPDVLDADYKPFDIHVNYIRMPNGMRKIIDCSIY